MMIEPCKTPEACAEEAGWMHNPHGDGWFEIKQSIWESPYVPGHPKHRKSQGVCYMLRNVIWGNAVSNTDPDFAIRVVLPDGDFQVFNPETPLSLWQRILKWCLK